MPGNATVSHVCRVDNVWMLASSQDMYAKMIGRFTRILRDAKLEWKPKSSEYMTKEAPKRCRVLPLIIGDPLHVISTTGKRHDFARATSMILLGAAIDINGSTQTSMRGRLARASRAACANKHKWYYVGNLQQKLRAWQSEVQSIALRGARAWELTSNIVDRLRT